MDYKGVPDTTLRGGRFRLKIDNDRFVGNVGFRQNEQTFEGFQFTNTTLPKTRILYAYLGKAHGTLGDDIDAGNQDMDTHIANIRYSRYDFATFALYNYYLKFDEIENQANPPTTLASAFGARFPSSMI